MSCRFKYGDKVIVNGKNGTIKSITKDHIHYICKVEFDNRFLIPREMEFEECQISFANSDKEKCPVCNEKWTISRFNNKEWRDCLKCNEKSEVIIEKLKNKTDNPKNNYEINDTDEDDFGLYYPSYI